MSLPGISSTVFAGVLVLAMPVYAVDTGRVCVAAINQHNVDYVAKAVAKVIE